MVSSSSGRWPNQAGKGGVPFPVGQTTFSREAKTVHMELTLFKFMIFSLIIKHQEA